MQRPIPLDSKGSRESSHGRQIPYSPMVYTASVTSGAIGNRLVNRIDRYIQNYCGPYAILGNSFMVSILPALNLFWDTIRVNRVLRKLNLNSRRKKRIAIIAFAKITFRYWRDCEALSKIVTFFTLNQTLKLIFVFDWRFFPASTHKTYSSEYFPHCHSSIQRSTSRDYSHRGFFELSRFRHHPSDSELGRHA